MPEFPSRRNEPVNTPESKDSMPDQWIEVTTTLPKSQGPAPELRTKHLIIRPLAQSDLTPLHRLRTQPAFMKHTTTGLPDTSLRDTQDKLNTLLNAPASPACLPFPTYFGVFLRSTGELIGDGGVHLLSSPACGWPELGCKFASEFCGRGFGTEFMRAFTAWWWALPRGRARIRVHRDSVVWERSGDAVEVLYAWVAGDNVASCRMVRKLGFENFVSWLHPVKRVPVLGWRLSRRRGVSSKL